MSFFRQEDIAQANIYASLKTEPFFRKEKNTGMPYENEATSHFSMAGSFINGLTLNSVYFFG